VSGRAPAPRPLTARLLSALVTGGVIALWCGLAPTSLGGDYSYVVVHGNSMEPHLSGGDIVLLRREASYGLGEVVAYRDPTLGAVLHRIEAKDGERYVLRGDNRERADSHQPAAAEVIGREAATWPGGLRVILAVTSPATLTVLVVAVVALGLAVYQREAFGGPRYRRRGTHAGWQGRLPR
jgi:signal peptidase I